MAVQAAIKGGGVALGREPLVIDALQEGQLVLPFPNLVASDYSYWLVCGRQTAQAEHRKIFMDWLAEEVERQPDMAGFASPA